jgi:hypothetical protein
MYHFGLIFRPAGDTAGCSHTRMPIPAGGPKRTELRAITPGTTLPAAIAPLTSPMGWVSMVVNAWLMPRVQFLTY